MKRGAIPGSTAKKHPPRKRSPRTPAWGSLLTVAVEVKPEAPQAFSVNEKLVRLTKSLGQNATAELLAFDPAQLRRCLKGEERISPAIAERIVDLEYILDRALRIFYPDEVGPWLTQPEPLLGGAVPLNALVLRGTAPVIAALTRIAAGAFS